MTSTMNEKQTQKKQLLALLAAALLVHVVLAMIYRGYETDMTCFTAWADRVFGEGFGQFYSENSFSDYPPGYMYILWVIGAVRAAFSMEFSSLASTVLVKMPAMICDLITGWLIYRLVSRESSHSHGIICAAIYCFNPAILLNSAIWGQVDSVMALFVVLMALFIYERKLPLAYVCFGIGFLVKPQMAFAFPLLVVAIIDQVFFEDFSWKKFGINLASGLAAIGGMLLLALPFGVDKVLSQYMDTVSSYPYASVNAYNLYAMFGLNWHAQTETVLGIPCFILGNVLLAAVMIVAVIIGLRCRRDRSKYFYVGAFLFIGIFTVSVRMHERYMFPALALLTILYGLRPKKKYLIGYGVITLVHFLNAFHVLFWYDPANFNWENPIPVVLGLAIVACFAWYCQQGVTDYLSNKAPEKYQKAPVKEKKPVSMVVGKPRNVETSKVFAKIKWQDYVWMAVICVLYAIVAFTDLGNASAPESGWETHKSGTQLVFAFDKAYDFSTMEYYMGNYHGVKVDIEYANDINGPWTMLEEDKELSGVFKWSFIDNHFSGKYVRFTTKSTDVALWELVFYDESGSSVLPENASDYMELFDEQTLAPERTTNLNSSYFDEIYHARTAYEYIHGLYSYENTHPPLGKWFISLGIRIFGMNPFGWRFVGCLFGVLMLPFIYLFLKRLFGQTWLSVSGTWLFAFDFMHFAQTRLATIDVFITFFVILMYYFMYLYTASSFYDTELKKTWIPLGLSGIAMGLGVASKWTGVYAGLGLAVLFFRTFWKRYQEYRYALQTPGGSTNGIQHSHIIKVFPKAAWKTVVFCCVFFVAIPVIIYALSYLPFRDGTDAGWIAEMIRNQKTMFGYHSKLVSEHPYSSRWYEWPLMVRPIWYYSGFVSETVQEGISAFGNPLVWWAGIPAFFYMIYRAITYKDKKSAFLIVAYLAQYVPWFFVSRTTYIYHYFPCVPFVVLMLTYCFHIFAGEHPRRRYVVFAYVAVAIGLFIMFYPVLSGHGVAISYVKSFLRWFNSWQLISAG